MTGNIYPNLTNVLQHVDYKGGLLPPKQDVYKERDFNGKESYSSTEQ